MQDLGDQNYLLAPPECVHLMCAQCITTVTDTSSTLCSSNQTDSKQSKLTQDDTQNDSQDDPKRQKESLWFASSM